MKSSNQNHIAFLLPSLDGGGVEKMSLNLAKVYHQQGKKVDIVVMQKKGVLLSQVPATIDIISLNAVVPIVSIPRLVDYLQTQKPDAMFSGITSINLASVIASIIAGVNTRIIISERVAISENIKTHFLKRLLPPLINWFYPSADQIVAVSQGLASDLSEVTTIEEDDVKVIYNPVVTKEMLSDYDVPNHPWFNDHDKDISIILGVGRLVEQKDFSTLIKAFAKVKTPARLLILGEGHDRPSLQKLITDLQLDDRVSMPGFADNPMAYMQHASVFVLSSIYEGLGNVVIEALAAGCPVVSTDCPYGPSEILKDGTFGKLVPVRDEEGLARAIDQTLSQSSDTQMLKSRAMDFSTERIAAQYSELFFADL